MPKEIKYKKDSVIFFDGETRSNKVYLLKEGVLIRTKLSPITAEEERTRVNKGEFFGIKAGLGSHIRDETIQVSSDAIIYEFTPSEFIAITKKHLKILFKMLTSFSNELRSIHVSLEKKLGTDEKPPEERLLDIAHYYARNKKYNYALYAFTKHQEIYPDSLASAEISEKIVELKQMLE